MKIIEHEQIIKQYPDLLRDESNISGGFADKIYIPADQLEMQQAITESYRNKIPITVSGGRTGIVGGAIPFGGNVISLAELKKCSEIYTKGGKHYIRVQSGVILDDLQKLADQHKLFFPPNPTETTASMGGITATDASGSRSYKYGSVRNFVKKISGYLINGDYFELQPNQYRLYDLDLKTWFNQTVKLSGNIPVKLNKNVAGYHLWKDIDLLDILVGSEGTLVIITQAEFELLSKPEIVFSGMFYFQHLQQILDFIELCEQRIPRMMRSLEYFDINSIAFMKRFYAGQPEINSYLKEKRLLFAEFEIEDIDNFYDQIEIVLNKCGSSMDDAYGGEQEKEAELIKNIRHALPEAVNQTISNYKQTDLSLRKVGTDMAVPFEKVGDFINLFEQLLPENLEYVVFGHIGEGHPHINILPRNKNELELAEQIYHQLAKQVVEWGGTVTAEHGLGKLKKDYLKIMYCPEIIKNMMKIKTAFDPDNLLGPGILWDKN
ncbi:MAG: FAD-binding oxidoreductase [bacterium]